MLASIIICTKNRVAALKETLQAFTALSIPAGLTTELVVVDNGSNDETSLVVHEARVANLIIRYVREETPGKSAAQNTGVAAAQGEVIIFTDDDVRPDPGWLENITKPIIDGHYDALAGKVCIAPQLLRPWMSEKHKAWLASTHYLNPAAPEAAVSANMAVSRRVFEKVPLFDPELGPGRLGFWDDTLFSLQLKAAGYRLGMATNAMVEHHFDVSRLSRNSFLSRAENEGRSLAYVTWHWKHEDRTWLALRAIRRSIELTLNRQLRAADCAAPEGIAVWEMELVSSLAFLRHFRKINAGPRAYEKHGLRKLS